MKYKSGILILILIVFFGSCAKEKNPLSADGADIVIDDSTILFTGNAWDSGNGNFSIEVHLTLKNIEDMLVIRSGYVLVSDSGYGINATKITNCVMREEKAYDENKRYKAFYSSWGGYEYKLDLSGKAGTPPVINSIKLDGYSDYANIHYPNITANIYYENISKLSVGEKYFSVYLYDIYGKQHIVNKTVNIIQIEIQEIVPYTDSIDIHNTGTWPYASSLSGWGELISTSGNIAKVKVLNSISDYIDLSLEYKFDWYTSGVDKYIVKSISVSDGVSTRYYSWDGAYYNDYSGYTFSVENGNGGPLIVQYK